MPGGRPTPDESNHHPTVPMNASITVGDFGAIIGRCNEHFIGEIIQKTREISQNGCLATDISTFPQHPGLAGLTPCPVISIFARRFQTM